MSNIGVTYICSNKNCHTFVSGEDGKDWACGMCGTLMVKAIHKPTTKPKDKK